MQEQSTAYSFRDFAGRHQEGTIWFPLDNAAKIFPSIQNARYTTLFRLAAVLDQPVRATALEHALQRVMQRFPYFQVELRRGLFWYYLERVSHLPHVLPDGRSPCMRFYPSRKGTPLLRVRVYRERLAVEFCHALTDGMGAAMFFRSLITTYFYQCGRAIADWGDIPHPEAEPSANEFHDANQIIGIEEYPPPPKRSKAFHMRGQMLPRHEYAVITGQMSQRQLRSLSRELGVTVNEYLTAVLFYAYQDWINSQPAKRRQRWKRRPVRLLLPVSLRQFYSTRTRRNFFVFVDPDIDLRLGNYGFAELARRLHNYMGVELNRKNLNRHLSRNIASERNWGIRVIPLHLKDLILKIVYRRSDRTNTTSFSNLGRFTFPAEVEESIRRVEVVPPPSPVFGTSAAAVVCGDTLTVSFGSLQRQTELEKRFFTILRRQGVHIKIISNREQLPGKEEVCPIVPNAE